METEWGEQLRKYRKEREWTAEMLARHTGFSENLILMVEKAQRRPSAALALACDKALGTSPLLAMMLGLGTGKGDEMKRRALIGAASLGGALAVTPLAHALRDGLWKDISAEGDYDAMVAKYARQFVVNSSHQFGESLLLQIAVYRQQLKEGQIPPKHRAALQQAVSRLALLYGLYAGNHLDFAQAAAWYKLADVYAEQSGDLEGWQYVLARTGNRTMFEGASLKDVRDSIDRALSLTKAPTPGRVEALAATVCLSGLMGDVRGGRRAMGEMIDVAGQLGAHNVTDLEHRIVFHGSYLESHVGTLAAAERAYDGARRALADLPYWKKENDLYWSFALVKDGDASAGVQHAVETLQRGADPIGVIRVAAREVHEAVPAGSKARATEEYAVLGRYASGRPGPWQTLIQ